MKFTLSWLKEHLATEASLDDILDTDKLLAEVDSLNKGSKTA